MKATGIVRRFDDLGRITVPKELRVIMGLEGRAQVEIYTDETGEIILKKFTKEKESRELMKEYINICNDDDIKALKVFISDREVDK